MALTDSSEAVQRVERVLLSGLRAWRSIAGRNTIVDRALRPGYRALRRKIVKKDADANFIVVGAGSRRDHRVGIYAKGSCDLVAILSCAPRIHRALDGTCCVIREGLVSDSRSDLLLQGLQPLSPEWTRPVGEKLRLPPDYFEPRLFDRTFTVPGVPNLTFAKDVVLLSIAPDVVRTLYRHREHGFLVDPGGWWLNQSLDAVLDDLAVATWFRREFVSVGRIGVDAFAANLRRIIELVRSRTGAHVLVLNVLTVHPGDATHNYQFVRHSPSVRRREFNLALVELSRRLDFSIVDVDRVVKRVGVSRQIDFEHFGVDAFAPVAEEAFRIMRERGVFE